MPPVHSNLLVSLVVFALTACGGTIASENTPADGPRVDSGVDSSVDSGACRPGTVFIGLNCAAGRLEAWCCDADSGCPVPQSLHYCDLGGGACALEPCVPSSGDAATPPGVGDAAGPLIEPASR